MARKEGSNRDTNDTATVTRVTINSVTATIIAASNQDRFHCSVDLEPGTTNATAYIRLYPAATDNLKDGRPLIRLLSGNDSILKSSWVMAGTKIYTGEISAISENGTFDLLVTEY